MSLLRPRRGRVLFNRRQLAVPLLHRQTRHRGPLHTSAFPINMQNVTISRQTCLLSSLPADSCEARSLGPGRAEPLAAASAAGGQEAPPPLVTAPGQSPYSAQRGAREEAFWRWEQFWATRPKRGSLGGCRTVSRLLGSSSIPAPGCGLTG